METTVSTTKNVTNDIANEIDSSNIANLWKDSTNYYLFHLESTCVEKFIAAVVILFQFFIYFFILLLTVTSETDNVTYPVHWQDNIHGGVNKNTKCAELTFDAYNATRDVYRKKNMTYSDLYCMVSGTGGNGPGGSTFLLNLIIITLLSCFLMPDVVRSFKSFSKDCRSCYAIIMILEAVFGFLVGSISGNVALSGVGGGSVDALMATIGVIFVHDLDEKVFEGMKLVSNRGKLLVIGLVLTVSASCAFLMSSIY